jgi:hypothetical protein
MTMAFTELRFKHGICEDERSRLAAQALVDNGVAFSGNRRAPKATQVLIKGETSYL